MGLHPEPRHENMGGESAVSYLPAQPRVEFASSNAHNWQSHITCVAPRFARLNSLLRTFTSQSMGVLVPDPGFLNRQRLVCARSSRVSCARSIGRQLTAGPQFHHKTWRITRDRFVCSIQKPLPTHWPRSSNFEGRQP